MSGLTPEEREQANELARKMQELFQEMLEGIADVRVRAVPMDEWVAEQEIQQEVREMRRNINN